MPNPSNRLLYAAALIVACGGGDVAAPAETAPTNDVMETPAGAMMPITTAIPLKAVDMENFVAVVKEMRALGDKYKSSGKASDIGKMGTGFAASSEAMAILRKHDFKDQVEFQRVTFSVGAAMAAAEMEGKDAEMAASRAKLAELKSTMGEEQYNKMMQAQAQSMGMITNQPAGNVELVKEWRDRIESATGN